MADKIKISKIQININGKTLHLSLKDAQELKKVLNDAFPEEERVVYKYHYPSVYPYVTWQTDMGTTTPTITYSDSNTTAYITNQEDTLDV